MKLSKTALGILCAKYRAVLIRCLLASAVVFPSIANALQVNGNMTLNSDVQSDYTISFQNEPAVLDGQKKFAVGDKNGNKTDIGASSSNYVGTLKDITIIAGQQIDSSVSLNISGDVYFDAGTSVSLINITGSADGSSKIHADTGTLYLNGNTYSNISMDAGTSKVSRNSDALLDFFGNNTITADTLNIDTTVTVKKDASLTFVSNNAALFKSLDLYGDFKGNLKSDKLHIRNTGSFSGTFEGNVRIADRNVDLSKQKFSDSSTINELIVSQMGSKITLNSDFTATQLTIDNGGAGGKISGTGTLKIDKVVGKDGSRALSFDGGIKIAAKTDNLSFSGSQLFSFANAAVSADNGTITMEAPVSFGNSSVNAKTFTVNNTLTFSYGTSVLTADTFNINKDVKVEWGASLTLNNLGNNGFTMNDTMTVEEGAKVTLNSKAAPEESYINALHLYGDFTGDLSVGTLWLYSTGNFSGKIVEKNDEFSGRVTIADTNVDMAQLKLSEGSNIKTLEVNGNLTDANISLNSDFTANTFRVLSFTTGTISGTGTLKIDKAVIADKSTFTFKNIKIAANGNNLSVEHAGSPSAENPSSFIFENVALSAPGTITLSNENTVFKGNSSLTAKNITVADNITIKGTLTVNGVLDAGSHTLTGGTLNIVLPEAAATTPIITANASNIKLTLDLKNVENEAAQQYQITNKSDGYTLSGKYGRYAFSASDFTLDEYRKNKGAFTLTQDLWDASNGTLWIMKIKGGVEAALSDLRSAGVFVSPTEESASKILDLVADNPYAGRLLDLLDSGDLGLQKQALRETVPTDAAQSSFKTARETALSVMNTVAGRMGNASAVSGRSGGDLTVGRSSVWAQGMVNRAKMTGGDGFKSDTAGFAAGVETNLTDEIKAGFGYAFASTDIKTDRSKTDADTHTGFVYGEYAPGKLYVNAVAGFGRSDYDDTTRIAGMKSSFGADTYSARVAAGYDAGMLTPEAALRFVSVRQKAYTDALGARVSAKNLNTTTAVAGAKAGREFFVGKYGVSPELRLAATYDLQRPNEGRAVTLPDGSSYVAAGEHLKRLGAEIGAKAAVRLTNDVEVSLTYDGAFKEHYQNHTGLINVSVGF